MSDPLIRYMGGKINVWDYLDIDKVSISIIDQLFKEHEYLFYCNVHWLVPNFDLEYGVISLNKDNVVHELYKA